LIPLISIDVNKSLLEIRSGEKTNLAIQIFNEGNGFLVVEGIISDYDESVFDLSLDPHIIFTDIDESKNMTFEVQTIYYPFQNTLQQVDIKFWIWNPYTGEKYDKPLYANIGVHVQS